MSEYDEITNSNDTIDSRDIQERIDYLETLEGDNNLDDYEKEELELLRQLKNDVSSSEWKYGLLLIRDSYFEDYAQEFAEDCGLIEDNAKWPATCIDWEQASRELQMDYSSVEFGDVTYWYLAS